ncbi:hypothetical protein ACTXT7_003767 [Hymenolepis weldensis]
MNKDNNLKEGGLNNFCKHAAFAFPSMNIRTEFPYSSTKFSETGYEIVADATRYNQCYAARTLVADWLGSLNKPVCDFSIKLLEKWRLAQRLPYASVFVWKDVNVPKPDERSIMTYVSSMYQMLNKHRNKNKNANRVGKTINQAIDLSSKINEYEVGIRDLLQWIRNKSTFFRQSSKNLPTTLNEVTKALSNFTQYRRIEKSQKTCTSPTARFSRME